ncbi:MAG: RHS repeat-associated core domain-containing protein, partial [Lachnospiraceae bacterium]|nr:RHS repeat-associated core domain-containing protein [Lachnospiraceae bacterium]
SNGYHYYHQNEHGDIEYITGKDGKIENAYTYDAFGNITNSTELIKNRYTYNGEQYDQVTQQYYLRARYYNPRVGRFTQEDVYRGDGLNLYAYCDSNPVMYVDPSGYAETYDPTTNLYPTRTTEAQAECQIVVDVVNNKIIPGEKNRNNSVISVFTHEDNTVSVGFSGASDSNRSKAFASKLQSELDKIAVGKYSVSSGISDTLQKRMESTSKGVPGNAIGDCAEPKAATAAHENKSPITGMDTRNRLVEKGTYADNPHPYTGNDGVSKSQMDPCDTCKAYEREYMQYANENKSNPCDA